MAAAPKKAAPPADKKDLEQVDPRTGELTSVTGGAVALVDDDSAAYADDAGAGYENQTQDDMSVPFLTVLQPGSPEVQGEDALGRAGMIINKTTGTVSSGKEGVSFVPAVTEHECVEWVPRDKGGGMVGRHAMDSDVVRKARSTQELGSWQTEAGNDLVETFYVYGVAMDGEGNPFPAVLTFSSTHIKSYQDWMFRARSIVVSLPDGRKITKMPLFSHAYTMKTQLREKNGNSWYVPVVTFAGEDAASSRLSPSSPLYLAAKSVHAGVTGGVLKANEESLRGGGSSDDGEKSALKKGSTNAEKAPY